MRLFISCDDISIIISVLTLINFIYTGGQKLKSNAQFKKTEQTK